jgi:N-acetylglucosamine-6-phosphate deacetylase
VGRGVVVSMGHTDATYEQAARGVDLGATLVTHLFNAMRPFGHRDPGIIGYTLSNPVAASVIADGVHSDLGALRLAVRAKAPDALVVTTDAISGLGMPSAATSSRTGSSSPTGSSAAWRTGRSPAPCCRSTGRSGTS